MPAEQRVPTASEGRAVPVIQADRDAAIGYMDTGAQPLPEHIAGMRNDIVQGRGDHYQLTQAFARHRLAFSAQPTSGAGVRSDEQDKARAVLEEHLGDLGLGAYPLSKRRREKIIAAMLAYANTVQGEGVREMRERAERLISLTFGRIGHGGIDRILSNDEIDDIAQAAQDVLLLTNHPPAQGVGQPAGSGLRSLWRKLKQARAVGDPHGWDHWAAQMDAALSAPEGTPKPPPAEVEQVGDGVLRESVFDLTWIGAPRPPVHPNPMTGRQMFHSFDKAVAFFGKQPADATFVSLIERQINRVDRSEDARTALALPRSDREG